MSGELVYARYNPSDTRVHSCNRDGPAGRTLVYDLAGEIRAPLLRDRLMALDAGGRFDRVLLRGASELLRAQLGEDDGRLDLEESFPGAALWSIDVIDRPCLVRLTSDATLSAVTPAGTGDGDAGDTQLLQLCAQAELEAALVWHNAIWHDPASHFVVPSGHHADKFVRIGDIFVDPLNVSRVADWCAPLCSSPCVLVADSFTLLPLLQELELRALRARLAQGPRPRHDRSPSRPVPKFIVPLYGVPEDQVRERLSEIVPIAREASSSIAAVVSVVATGGYVSALNRALASFAAAPPLRVLAVCSTSGSVSEPRFDRDRSTSHGHSTAEEAEVTETLCHIPVRSFPDQETCEMCRTGSAAVEIDQQRFTTRLGVKVLAMPRAQDIEASSLVIRHADEQGALRLHVDRPDRHGHLAIFIDTAKLMESRVFRAMATVALARTCMGFEPDLVLAPRHDGTDAMTGWLVSEGKPRPTEVLIDAPLPAPMEAAILASRSILLVDDAVITGRTLHALVELVQHIKGHDEDGAFELRGLVLVARPASASTWKRLSDRFYIGSRPGLHAAWEVNLPDVGVNGRAACPWCVEQRMLANLLPLVPDAAKPYIERRLLRLRDPAGLDSAIYLGAESALDAPAAGWDPAVHTTPGSYLGNVSDVGAFVGAAALLQSMRDSWSRSAERWSMRYTMPMATVLGRYTDPVIVAGLLRSVTAPEVWGETERELTRALLAFDHSVQHGVLAAEILLAARQRKLPRGAGTEAFVEHLRSLPEEIRSALEALLA